MRRLAGLVIGVLLMTSGTALAQDKGDVSGGWRFIRADGENYAKGWYFDVTGHVTDIVSIVGDVGGTYKDLSETVGGTTISGDFKVHGFSAGVKFRASMVHPNVVPFAQVLGGVGRSSVKFSGGGINFSESATDPLVNVSGGVDVNGGGRLGVRVQTGWVRVFEEGEGTNLFQFSVGAKIGF